MKKIHYKILYIPLILIMSGIFLYSYFLNQASLSNLSLPSIDHKESPPSIQNQSLARPSVVSQMQTITIKAGGIVAYIPIIKGMTLYQLMQRTPEIALRGKEYSGMGFFVTDIGTLHQGHGKYLMYYINNQEASSGISLYIPQSGDIIEWKLK